MLLMNMNSINVKIKLLFITCRVLYDIMYMKWIDRDIRILYVGLKQIKENLYDTKNKASALFNGRSL